MATKMNKTEIIEMLFVLADMITAAKSGTNFVEISTYVKNHVPGIEPEFVEAFRDILGPILHREKLLERYRYLTMLFEMHSMSQSDYEEWCDICNELAGTEK